MGGRKTSKFELLEVRHNLHNEPNRENGPSDVVRCAQLDVSFGFASRVYKHDRHRDDEDPKHLEDPEAQKAKEFGAHFVKAVVLFALAHAHQQKARQVGTAEAEQGRQHYLSRSPITSETTR